MGEEILLTPSCNTKPVSSSSSSPSVCIGIPGIIRKAIHFPLKNKKLMLQVFMLILSPFIILVLLHSVIATPLMAKVEESYENSSLNHQELTSLVVIEIPFAFAFCTILTFASAITIVATVSTHQVASIGLKEMLHSNKSKWKKIIVSGLYLSFLEIAFFGVTALLTRITAPMGLLAAVITYPYLASISTLVLVFSMEDDFQAKKAFKRAREIIGREKFQGYFLMLVLVLLSIPVYALFYVTSTDDDDENGLIARFGFLSVTTVLFCLTICFNNVVYTLFYLDYKQRSGETLDKLETKYQLVPTLTNADS